MQSIHVSPPTPKVCVSTLRGEGEGSGEGKGSGGRDGREERKGRGGREGRREREKCFDQVSCVQMKLQNIVNLNYTVTLVMRVFTRFTADTSLPTPAR